MTATIKQPVTFYAESTPNPETMKFVANLLLIQEGATAEYESKAEAVDSPLAQELFSFPFVKSVFICNNFVAITKIKEVTWDFIVLELRTFLKRHVETGKAIIEKAPSAEVEIEDGKKEEVFTEHAAPKNDLEHKIIEALEEYIRPAVEQDGGLITFRSFIEGVVTVDLKGACSGCPSSTVTLKSGIEGLLKRMIPEVKEVVAEAV